MDRKALVIIVITIGLLLGWHFGYYAPRAEQNRRAYAEHKKRLEEEKARQQPAVAATGTAQQAVASPAQQPALPAPAAQASVPEERRTIVSGAGSVSYEFTTHGGGIARVQLKEHFKDKTKGTNVVINEFGTIPVGALTEEPGDDAFVKLPWTMSVDEAAHTVTFERTDEARRIKTVKKFTLPREKGLKEEYVISLDVTFTNLGENPVMAPASFVHIGSAAPLSTHDGREHQGFDWWRDGDNHFQDVNSFSAGGILMWSHGERPVYRQESDKIRWAAVTSQYFTTMVTVLGYNDGNADDEYRYLGRAAWAKRSEIPADAWSAVGQSFEGAKAGLHKVDGALGLREIAIAKGESATRNLRIYAGPREYRRLRLLDNREKDVLNYGSFLGIPTGPFSRLLLNSMNALYGWTGSYFLAIILLTIIVKAILWPLQNKANKNMKKMAAMQPEIKALQDKYKEDPVRFQQEMGKLWKKAGANPLSGCWPIFIQIPIFIGFYNMLGKAVELRHHGFAWVKDLSQPDTIAHLFGLPINPLPLIMAGTMFLQMAMTPQTGDPAQRRIFMFMPLIFIFLCYNFASALALYWTVQNVISIVQLKMNRDSSALAAKPAAN